MRGRRAPARAAVCAVRASAVRVGERAIRGRRRRGGQIGLGHVRRDGAEGIVRESATILPPQARAWRGDRREHLVRHDSIYTRDTQAGKRVRSHQTGLRSLSPHGSTDTGRSAVTQKSPGGARHPAGTVHPGGLPARPPRSAPRSHHSARHHHMQAQSPIPTYRRPLPFLPPHVL